MSNLGSIRFADHKQQVIELLRTVSVETMKILRSFPS